MNTSLRQVSIALAVCLMAGATASAQTTTGTWTLYPPQGIQYMSSVRPPIQADGTSSWPAKRGEIPVKFRLLAAAGPVVFESIFSDNPPPALANPGPNDFSFLRFTPSPGITFNQLTNLQANYGFTMGTCIGGSLRWQVRVDIGSDSNAANDANVFIYYGDLPNLSDCTTNNQSGVNLIGQPDLRYDTSQIAGGTFYDSYGHALTLVGTLPVVRASLVIDSGWAAGDQKLNVSNVTVNDNTFVPISGTPTQTCALPPATIKVTKMLATPVPSPRTVQPNDDDTMFRIVDCQYIYNLDIESLLGVGTYEVAAVIGGTPLLAPAVFSLR